MKDTASNEVRRRTLLLPTKRSKNVIMRESHRTGVSTFANRTSPSTDQSLQKSFHLSHPDKIELKKISTLSENKKYATTQPDTDRQMAVAIQTPKPLTDLRFTNTMDNRPAYNSTLAKKPSLWVIEQLCFLKTFVQVDSFVQVNRLLRQARNRQTV